MTILDERLDLFLIDHDGLTGRSLSSADLYTPISDPEQADSLEDAH